MAEINIEKKKTIWPWVALGLLIVAAIIAYFLWFDNDSKVDDGNPVTVEEAQPVENSKPMLTSNTESTIASYASFIDEDMDMGLDHEYSHTGLTKLIEAVREVAADLDVDIDLTEAKNDADFITKDPTDVDHANKIRSAAQMISRAIGTIQQERFPQLAQEIDKLKDAAQSVMPDTQTLNQKDDVKAFLQEAKNVLNKMK